MSHDHLKDITPLVLTFNEAPNLARTLEQLRWARDIVVVDSLSTDDTVDIANSFSSVRVFQRKFDNHGSQWNFGLQETGISTEWVLALDADFVLSPELVDEMGSLEPSSETRAYLAPFTYCINGRPLRSGLLKSQVVLYQRRFAKYAQDGHTQRLEVQGDVEELRCRILHDDRKPLMRWFESQRRYMSLEARKIIESDRGSLGRADRVRRWRLIAPPAVLIYCLFIKGGLLDGWAGFHYAFQRTCAELMLSLFLLEHDLHFKVSRFPTSEQPHVAPPEAGEQLLARGEQTDAAR